MPLSDHEQRLLEQMERALSAEDPKFASALRGVDRHLHRRRRILLGVLGTIAGIAMLVVGVATALTAVGVVGFLLVVASVIFALTTPHPGPGASAGRPRTGPAKANERRRRTSRVGFMSRFEQRWENRRDNFGR
ncbi:MAG: DUF3040 domain-containing protein [Actinomycetes bacterium]